MNSVDALADLSHRAGALDAGDERRLGRVAADALPFVDVAEVDARRVEVDEQLSGARPRLRLVARLEDLGAALLRHDDRVQNRSPPAGLMDGSRGYRAAGDESAPTPGSECVRRRFEEARTEMLGQQETAVMDRNSRFERAGRGVHVPFFVAGPGAREDAPADGGAGAAPGDDAPRPMPAARTWAIVAAALLAGVGVMAVQVLSDHQDAKAVWAVFAPAVGWSFVGTGLYAWRRRPDSRTGALMVLLGFAWFVYTLDAANPPAVYTLALVLGGLWGGVFLHLGLSFPTGRLQAPVDRALAVAGYVIFPLAFVPALLFAGPRELGCDGCPENVLLVHRDPDLARGGDRASARSSMSSCSRSSWRAPCSAGAATTPFERLQLTPVYVCALLTFLLVTVARAGAGEAAWWAAFVSTGLMPFAFLGGLLRSHVSHLDAELRERLEELRASRARLVEAGDAERRRLERDLHDGAQARLVALSMLLAHRPAPRRRGPRRSPACSTRRATSSRRA